MGNRSGARDLWRRMTGVRTHPPRTATRALDVDLIIEAARLVVTTRLATRTLLIRKLDVTGHVADQLLLKLEHCEVIAPPEPGRAQRVLTTSAQLPGVVEEFRRRVH